MSVMATMLTREDLDALPDDGRRHELIDGTLVMSPSPGLPHQSMLLALYRALWNASRDTGLKVMLAPFDVALGPHVVAPDLIVAPNEAFTARDLPIAPLLVAEVRSASTGWLDGGRKRTMYEEYGVASYWMLDPARPSITILRLVNGRYTEVATVADDQEVEIDVPFSITLCPADLAQG